MIFRGADWHARRTVRRIPRGGPDFSRASSPYAPELARLKSGLPRAAGPWISRGVWSALGRLALTSTALLLGASAPGRAEWPTYQGNLARTGNLDGKAGPTTPRILWAHRANEQYVAPPVPGERALYASGLGAFNTAAFHALALDADRILWTRSTPFLKLPVVAAPAIAGGKLIFGDGMHQTDGAVLRCLEADTGLPLWQLAVDGRLVHLEGSPTVADGRVYVGGGGAGVFCVDAERVTLDGKDCDLAAVRSIRERRRAELQASYEAEKRKDPDFAVPPTEDALPKPAPRLVWNRGKEAWHVDAPVAVVGDRVLAASAFLDAEKVGERALFSLKAADGAVAWKVPLKINPLGAPAVLGKTVAVGCSTIRFDPKLIAVARGEVVAVNVDDGSVRWRKDVPGGVVGAPAAAGALVIFTATDGKVRAWDLDTGKVRWTFAGKAPFFAGPAIAGEVVYVADLKGVIRALGLADGKPRWALDLAADPAAGAIGKVYGPPVLHGGRLYVATCDLDEGASAHPSAVVCIGEK